jgi:hypothetical protein
MMRSKWVAGLLAAAVVLPLNAARAEIVDMGAITCGDLLKMKSDDVGTIMLWMHGYFGGMNDDTKFDQAAFQDVAKTIGAYCAVNQKVTLLSAFKEANK